MGEQIPDSADDDELVREVGTDEAHGEGEIDLGLVGREGGHYKIESTVRYLGKEVDDAIV